MTDRSRRRLTSCFVGALCLPRTRRALAANSGKTSAKGLAFAISSAVNSGESEDFVQIGLGVAAALGIGR